MSVTTTCRDIKELTTAAQTAIKLLFQECVKAGITGIFVTETYRSQERQNYLYAQGRTRPGQVVTWTTKSNHLGRLAWDIAVSPPKDLYDTSTLNKVGAIAQKLGITWGGQPSWVAANKTDRPHFEVKSTWTMPKGYQLEGEIIIPTDSKTKAQIIKKQSEPSKGELKFTDDALKKNLDMRLKSPASHRLVNNLACKKLGYTSRLNNGLMTDGDFIATSIELAIHQAKNEK